MSFYQREDGHHYQFKSGWLRPEPGPEIVGTEKLSCRWEKQKSYFIGM
jgi:hypothetical protein